MLLPMYINASTVMDKVATILSQKAWYFLEANWKIQGRTVKSCQMGDFHSQLTNGSNDTLHPQLIDPK